MELVAKPATKSTGTQSNWRFYTEFGFWMGSETRTLRQSSSTVASPRGARDILSKLYQGSFDTKVPFLQIIFMRLKTNMLHCNLELKGSS